MKKPNKNTAKAITIIFLSMFENKSDLGIIGGGGGGGGGGCIYIICG
jgi:hypothetical protein